MRVGVLALQGAFREHIMTLEALGVSAVAVRKPEQMGDLNALITSARWKKPALAACWCAMPGSWRRWTL